MGQLVQRLLAAASPGNDEETPDASSMSARQEQLILHSIFTVEEWYSITPSTDTDTVPPDSIEAWLNNPVTGVCHIEVTAEQLAEFTDLPSFDGPQFDTRRV